MRRRFFPHRQAYAPRKSTAAMAAIVLSVVVALGLGVRGLWQGAATGFLCAQVVVQVQWRLWRRRHPVLPPDELSRTRREAAPWN